jgi:hypothetical protein
MDTVARSRDQVEAALATLEASYDAFPVNQTSVTVPPALFEAVSERCRAGTARIDVYVRDDRGRVLVVERDDDPLAPSVVVDRAASVPDRAREAVRSRTGVEFADAAVREATIAGVRDERDPEADPIYRLIALLDGEHVAGDPGPRTCWTAEPPVPPLLR